MTEREKLDALLCAADLDKAEQRMATVSGLVFDTAWELATTYALSIVANGIGPKLEATDQEYQDMRGEISRIVAQQTTQAARARLEQLRTLLETEKRELP